MKRSKGKGPFVDFRFIEEIQAITKKKKTKTFSRSSTILPKHIDLNINIYNGRRFIPVKIKENMVGHKLGEFALTRLPFKYKK